MKKDKVVTEDEAKRAVLRTYLQNDKVLDDADSETLQKYREIIEEGCAKEWPEAYEVKAYACYGGSVLYECDWTVSRDCLLHLLELQEDADPFICNTLGYIYYYGRCNDGVPEYDKALKYFSVGAACGVYESQYKLADMYLAGNGVPQNKCAAANVIDKLYGECIKAFCDGQYDGKFADVAYRMAGLCERGDGMEEDMLSAYACCLQARFSINKRMELMNYYGDKKVKANIETALERVEKKLPEDTFMESFALTSPRIFGALLSKSVGLDIEVFEKDGSWYIKARRMHSEDNPPYALITIPEMKLCDYMEEATYRLQGIDEDEMKSTKAFITTIHYDENEGVWQFLCRKQVMLAIKSSKFVFEGEYKSE